MELAEKTRKLLALGM